MLKTHILEAIACSIVLVSCQNTQDAGPCTDCAEKTGAVAMTFALSDATIARVVATITGPGIASPITADLTIAGSPAIASGTVRNVPSGPGRSVLVQAYPTAPEESVVIYRGASSVDITSGQIAKVSLNLLPVLGDVAVTAIFPPGDTDVVRIDHATIIVSGNRISSTALFFMAVDQSAGTSSGVALRVPVGTTRTVTATSFAADGLKLHEGASTLPVQEQGSSAAVSMANVTGLGGASINGEICVGSCGSNVCGDDGCGGSCGGCKIGDSCTAGSCLPPPPLIASFGASPTTIGPGGASTLSWSTNAATSLVIDNAVGDVTGTTSVVVRPGATTIYTLTAASNSTSATSQATVAVSSAQGTFLPTGDLLVGRGGHTSTLLPNGKVLVTGGAGRTTVSTAEAELYDEQSGIFTFAGNMAVARDAHTATLLPNGKVLIAGGKLVPVENGATTATADLYDPQAGTFVAAASMSTPRVWHIAALLGNGKVLIAGGTAFDRNGILATAELYDPASDTFTPTGSMTTARYAARATVLRSGKVLVAGGDDIGFVPHSTAELYDPDTGTFSATGNMSDARELPSAILLLDGRVLVSGGAIDQAGGILASAELYDPGTGLFSVTGDMTQTRYEPTTTMLADGRVLLTGGGFQGGDRDTTEVYAPASGTFSPWLKMASTRFGHTATVLPDGLILIAGGLSSDILTGSAFLFVPPF